MTELNLFKARHCRLRNTSWHFTNRRTGSPCSFVIVFARQTMQRILSAEDIASPPFQNWLKNKMMPAPTSFWE